MPTRLVRPSALLIACTFVVLSAAARSSTQVSGSEQDSAWFAQWKERAAQLHAYKQAPSAKLSDTAKRQTISWLEREADYTSTHFRNTGTGLDEEYGEYYVDLALFVAGLKDVRSIGALTKAMDVAGRISTTLAEFGDPGVQPVLIQLNNPFLRSSAIFTLGKFIQGSQTGRSKISEANIRTIRRVLLDSCRDNSPSTRISAVQALGYFKNDSEVNQALQELADHDPYSVVRDPASGIVIFPVRKAAKLALGEGK